MNFRHAAALAAVLALAACASSGPRPSAVHQSVAQDGSKVVTMAAQPLACEGMRCPVLAAAWSSAKPGQALLTVGLPGQPAAVSGADFRLMTAGVVRLRLAAHGEAPQLGYPATAFDVPLTLIERIAYTQRSSVKVYTDDGRSVEEGLNGAEGGMDARNPRSRASEVMAQFLVAVQSAGGGEGLQAPGGGLLQLLGDEHQRK